MSGVDKVWSDLGGRPMLFHCLTALAPRATEVVVVVRPDNLAVATRAITEAFPKACVVPGGIERQDSVRAGLEALRSTEVVAVHDAARPFARADMLESGARLLDRYSGAIPALPVDDTVKRVGSEGVVAQTLDRADLRRVQTPQVFQFDTLLHAHATAARSGVAVTDDAALLENLHLPVGTFPGDPMNFKVTTEWDLRLARIVCKQEDGWTSE
jgi:2-C-methyl-D-erythritol 4-phosphate cytidylyltransferase